MSEAQAGNGSEFSAQVAAMTAQTGAIDKLLEEQRSDEVYGLSTWEPKPGQAVPAIFGASRDGLLGRYHYELRVYGYIAPYVPDASYRGLAWTAFRGEVDPDTLKLQRRQHGSYRNQVMPAAWQVAPFASMALDGAQCFNPDTHGVRLHKGELVVARRGWGSRAVRGLGRLVGRLNP